MKGKEEEEEEDIIPTSKVEEEGERGASVSVSGSGAAAVGGDEGEEETKDNGQKEAALAAPEGVIKSLSSSLLALVGMGGESVKEKEGQEVNVEMKKAAAATVGALDEESKEMSSL